MVSKGLLHTLFVVSVAWRQLGSKPAGRCSHTEVFMQPQNKLVHTFVIAMP
jgi:hypothetical protein